MFSRDLSGKGASLFGGRWNSIGVPAVYTSFTISLALVELFIHKRTYDEIVVNQLLQITIDEALVHKIEHTKIKKGWQHDAAYCQFMGNAFLKQAEAICLSVPSAIVEQESNLVLNPLAKDFNKKVKIKSIKPFQFDERLFK
jgi:RES domain-containing protein